MKKERQKTRSHRVRKKLKTGFGEEKIYKMIWRRKTKNKKPRDKKKSLSNGKNYKRIGRRRRAKKTNKQKKTKKPISHRVKEKIFLTRGMDKENQKTKSHRVRGKIKTGFGEEKIYKRIWRRKAKKQETTE